ncbi:MAG: HEAT repeat domain-containing protein [Planctomycetota bacterium]|nr:HEAT repeat domain-containing protein [Planctomycetota bacterium]
MAEKNSTHFSILLALTLSAVLALSALSACESGAESDSAQVREAYVDALKAESPRKRAAAVRKLGMYLPDSVAVRGLKAVFEREQDASVLLEAVESCKTKKAEALSESLLALVSHPDIDVNLQSARAAHVIDAKKAKGALHRLAHTPGRSPLPYLRALVALSKRGEYEDFLKYLSDKRPEVRSVALSALVQLGAVKKSNHAVKMLSDRNEAVRREAIRAAAHFRDKNAIPHLIALLGEGNYSTQAHEALKELSREDFKPDPAVWQRWWKAAEKDFRAPEYEYLSSRGKVRFFKHSPEATRVVYMLDLSDSMGSGNGSSLEAQFEELESSLYSLPPTLSFNLVAYSRGAESFVPTALRADMPAILSALKWLRMQGTDKYTSSYDGFKKALAVRDAEVIFFSGNGLPNWGDLPSGENPELEDNVVTAVRKLRKELNPKIRIFTVGFPFQPDLHESGGGNLLPKERTKRIRTFEKRAAGFFRLLAALNDGEFCYVDKTQSDTMR